MVNQDPSRDSGGALEGRHRYGAISVGPVQGGWRVEADATGTPVAVVGLAAAPVAGELATASGTTPLTLNPNDRVDLATGVRATPGFTAPVF